MDYSLFEEIKASISDLKDEKALLTGKLKDLINQKEKAEEYLTCSKEAQVFLSAIAKETQSEVEEHLMNTVTLALLAVETDDEDTPKPPEFIVRMVERRDNIECDLLFKEGEREQRPKDCSGFGYIDIADYALRIVFIILELEYLNPDIRMSMILDEPFRNADKKLQVKISSMLNMVSDDLGFQQIIASHADGVIANADKVYTVTKNGKISQVSC